MQNTGSKLNIFGFIILAAAFLAGVFLSLNRVDSFLKLKAMGDCALASRYEDTPKEGVKVSYPVEEMYKNCLREKGY